MSDWDEKRRRAWRMHYAYKRLNDGIADGSIKIEPAHQLPEPEAFKDADERIEKAMKLLDEMIQAMQDLSAGLTDEQWQEIIDDPNTYGAEGDDDE